MPTQTYAGKTVELTDEGFLLSADAWTPEVAKAIAKEVGVGELTEAHWKVINFMRQDFTEKGEAPGLRRISMHSGVGMKQLYELFPKGPGKLAARIAGVPKPRSCL